MKQGSFVRNLAFASCLLLTAVSQPTSAISINLNFTGGLTTSQQAIFTQAGTFWESVLIGYQPDINIPSIAIEAHSATDDGVGGSLASAGPDTYDYKDGFWFTTTGSMTIDSADLPILESNGTLEDVILHEMAHVLGFGTLWSANYVYRPDSGEYTGANALAMWQTEFSQPGAPFVPVELGGGVGHANSHWNEVDYGSADTGITDNMGRDMRYELMTGWLNSTLEHPSFISDMTKMSFMDIGYEVAIVPVPAAVWLFISGFGVLFGFASGKRRAAR